MSKQLFRKRATGNAGALDNLIQSIRADMQNAGTGIGYASKAQAQSVLSMESMSQTDEVELVQVGDRLAISLEQMIKDSGITGVRQAAKDAAAFAGVVGSDVMGFLRTDNSKGIVSTENMVFIPATGSDVLAQRNQAALEAYDERETKTTIQYSVAYNLQAATQDAFGEAFYPTVTIAPDQPGYSVSIRLVNVMNEVRRQISGNFDDFKMRNVIHGIIDPTILRNDQTRVVPVVRTESTAKFVAAALVAPRSIYLDGQTIVTAPLKTGIDVSLLAISQTEALLETGLMDSTDSLDSSIVLDNLYFKVPGATAPDDRAFQVSTALVATAVFQPALQGNYRLMNLAFDSRTILVNKNTVGTDAVAIAKFAPIVAGDLSVRLAVKVSGGVNLETSNANLYASEVSVVSVKNAAGEELALDTGTGATIAALFVGVTVAGYDLEARRSNLNRRQRGQLLNTTFYNQLYQVPLLAPITIPRPLSGGDANDSSDLAALITTTHVRTSNAAVDAVLKVDELLKAYTSSTDQIGDGSEVMGIGRSLVRPTRAAATINMALAVDSLSSIDRPAAIASVLINKIRDMSYRMNRDSGYQVALDALNGGVRVKPLLVIGCDPVLAEYLQIVGDNRLGGESFDTKVVTTQNRRMAGKIVFSFGSVGKDGVPDPLAFGNMAWKPELTLVLPIHRNGGNSKELSVSPSFLHVSNLPVIGVIDVTNIEGVVATKVPVNMHTV